MESTYPYDKEFQVKLLALMAKEPTFMPSYADVIDADYFHDEASSLLARILLDSFGAHGKVPASDSVQRDVVDYARIYKLDEDTRRDLEKMSRGLYEVNLADISPDIQSRTVEFGKHRMLQAMTLQVGDMLSKGQDSDAVWSVYDTFRQHGTANGSEVVNLGMKLLNGVDHVRASSVYSAQAKISTGFPTLDRMMGGGIGRKQLMAVMGFTNVGKSMFLVNLGAAALKQRLPVIHISVGEMEEEDMLARYGSRLTGIDINDIAGTADVKELYESRMQEIMDKLRMEIYFKYISPYTSVSSIRSIISRVKIKDGIDAALVLIDNADELSSSHKSQEKYEEQGYVYTDLKSAAHDFDVAMMVDTQTNRFGGKSYIAGMDVMGESHRKSKKLDGLFSLNQSQEEQLTDIIRIHAIKGRRFRHGVEDVCYCYADKNHMTLLEISAYDPRVTKVRDVLSRKSKKKSDEG